MGEEPGVRVLGLRDYTKTKFFENKYLYEDIMAFLAYKGTLSSVNLCFYVVSY